MDSLLSCASLAGLAFACEYVDSTLGMGYGTALTPLLLLMGWSPLAVVPAILLSELFTGTFAAVMHHRAGNVFFDFSHDSEHWIAKKMGRLGYVPKSRDSRIAMVLGACSLVGAVGAVLLAINISGLALRLFIGGVVLSMGVLILLRHRKGLRFSWGRIVGLGVLAAFNKGLSGGGYGPLVTSGQILSGVESRSSVAITSLAEGFTCLVGVLTYLALRTQADWSLAPCLVVGAMLSVPFSAWTVKRISLGRLTLFVGIATTLLGILTLLKALKAI
ncbi:sulfite exporter TauE/SafE family protein [Candidatus Fermentibacterales bacterium]|nr:sulfite exporter TauE/SafE family protein [Candidatus Fermentibacterales bacterium]